MCQTIYKWLDNKKSGSSLSGFRWVQADAENLPFEDDSLDLYTIAFGIRNTTHIDKVCFVWPPSYIRPNE